MWMLPRILIQKQAMKQVSRIFMLGHDIVILTVWDHLYVCMVFCQVNKTETIFKHLFWNYTRTFCQQCFIHEHLKPTSQHIAHVVNRVFWGCSECYVSSPNGMAGRYPYFITMLFMFYPWAAWGAGISTQSSWQWLRHLCLTGPPVLLQQMVVRELVAKLKAHITFRTLSLVPLFFHQEDLFTKTLSISSRLSTNKATLNSVFGCYIIYWWGVFDKLFVGCDLLCVAGVIGVL